MADQLRMERSVFVDAFHEHRLAIQIASEIDNVPVVGTSHVIRMLHAIVDLHDGHSRLRPVRRRIRE